MPQTIEDYLVLLQIAADLVTKVRGLARANLTAAEYAELQVKWDALEDRTGRNAGLPDPSGHP